MKTHLLTRGGGDDGKEVEGPLALVALSEDEDDVKAFVGYKRAMWPNYVVPTHKIRDHRNFCQSRGKC